MTVSTTTPETPDEAMRVEHQIIPPVTIEEKLPMPRMVWILGFSMFLFNLSFVMMFPFSGLYLQMLGVSLVGIGFLEGLSEAASYVMKFASGLISDAFRRRKTIMMIGYFFSFMARPLMALSSGIGLFYSGKG